ncbi:GTP cyclohydrolase I FolE [Simkania negevensis]|uniref:GTP cyclohydrolase 1 n=1 Tax=Simkania negevensis TaxID=83561 RepID=A0ABS3AWR5_9BACT|nr:GTP cyclohydrolase I FolE [Simkania negevensis]
MAASENTLVEGIDLLQHAITQYPSPLRKHIPDVDNEEKIEKIAEKFSEIMEILGLDIEDESLSKTPQRIAKMYVEEIFSGLDPANFPKISYMKNNYKGDHSNVVLIKDISLTSFCEHHFVPFMGTACVAYIPNKQIVGLSKIHRVVRYFASRPQIQERLTAQIADSLSQVLDTEHVAVSITAQHFCVKARGVRDEQSTTSTHFLTGDFRNNVEIKNLFLKESCS